MHGYGHIIHGSKQTDLGMVLIVFSNSCDHVRDVTGPKSTWGVEITVKNGLFLEVYGLFNTLSDTVSI